MNKEKNWVPKFYEDGDEKAIVELMKEDITSRGSQSIFNVNFWKWKYRINNAGFFPHWIILAKSKTSDELSGHYTTIPVYLKAKDKTVLSAQSVDTLTQIDFRQQGIFTGLAKICYEQIEKDNIDVIYGYPNQNSYPGFIKKLEWDHIFVVDEVVYIINAGKISKLKFKKFPLNIMLIIAFKLIFSFFNLKRNLTNNSKIKFNEVKFDDIKFDDIDSWLGTKYQYYIDRSKEYLKWRYYENPIDKDVILKSFEKEGEVIGYFILKIKHYPHRNNLKVGHIMELLINPSYINDYKHILNEIVRLCSDKVDIIHAYTQKQQMDFDAFRKFGFIKYDSKHFIIRINSNKDNYPDIKNPENWFISQGDSDRA